MSAINWYFIMVLTGAIVLTIFMIPNLGIGIAIFYISYLLISLFITCITKLIHKITLKNVDENNEFEVIYRELMKSRSFGMLFIQAKAKVLRFIVMTSIFTILVPIFIERLSEYTRLLLIIGIAQGVIGIVFLSKYADKYNKSIKWNLLKILDEKYEDFNDSSLETLVLYKESGFLDNEVKYIKTENQAQVLLNQDELLKFMYMDAYLINKGEQNYLFRGIFGNLKSTNNIKSSIRILNHEIDGLNKMRLDNSDFNEYFDVYAEDINEARNVLCDDFQTKLVDLYENNDFDYEIIIKPNNIYFRIHTDKLPEARAVDILLDKKKLLYYYNMIKFILKLIKNIKFYL